MEWLQLAVSVLAGLATAIPLAINLVRYVQRAIKEKNWNKMLSLVMDLMKSAEAKFKVGSDKKEWVMAMVKASADSINYDVNMEAVGGLIDDLCDMSRIINSPEEGVA